MAGLIEIYWPYLLLGLAAVLALGWFLYLSNRKTAVVTDRRDVLDEGAAPAQRNQALIDAPRRKAEPALATDPIQPGLSASATDDLTRIKGLGPKIAARLAELGVTRFAEIAAWDDPAIDRIDAQLGQFQGRIRRDAWVEQAKLLSQGDESGFAAKFGQNG